MTHSDKSDAAMTNGNEPVKKTVAASIDKSKMESTIRHDAAVIGRHLHIGWPGASLDEDKKVADEVTESANAL